MEYFLSIVLNCGLWILISSDSSTSALNSDLVSLNPNASSYLPNVIGNKPKDKNTKIWVEAIYPDLIKKLDGIIIKVVRTNRDGPIFKADKIDHEHPS